MKGPAVVQPTKEIEGIGRRVMRTLIKRKAGTEARQIERKLGMQSDASGLSEHRAIDKHIIAIGRIELSVKQHR